MPLTQILAHLNQKSAPGTVLVGAYLAAAGQTPLDNVIVI
jgi:hypothetical protein